MAMGSKKLGILAATAGFVLMVFEIAAARILAPSIGSSTYVWTSVIGVIIMALSVGYWAGGRIADRRNNPNDIARLFLALSLTITFAMIMYPGFLSSVAEWTIDVRFSAVIASLVLFAPTSLLAGAVSPYLAKLNVRSLASSGSAVADLGALNSLGGIAGTFLTGFVLFGFMGVRDVMAVLAIGTLVVSWWARGGRNRRETLLMVAALVLAMLAWPGSGVLAIDTPSAHYTIEDATLSSGHTVRTLATGPGGKQSGIIVGSPTELAFWYTREIATVIDLQPAKQRIAVLGGGAYTLPAYLAQKYPDSQIDAVEIQEYFEYSPAKNVGHIAMDARTFINGVKLPYDIVVVDVFGDDSIPESLMTAEYGRALKRAVTPGGVVIINAIAGTGGTCLELFQAVSRPYLDNFATGYYLPRINDGGRSNITAVFGSHPKVPSNYIPTGPATGPIYTDDYNPTMRVQFACERR
ncbi:hypothetical protein B7Z00_04945 [Candidatus Saccharibacteria bacterium 32-50-10]|nr:MAG: hypothetical protein B7Z00_04945 [Candidatus Saccharibacteria bacterium 32-50-10]